jgi:hypothetical protein
LAAALPPLTSVATDISPGVWVVLMTSLPSGASATVVFNTPVGKGAPGPAAPGGAYELQAKPGDRLSFVTMFGWSNDQFYATPDAGLALFDGTGQPTCAGWPPPCTPRRSSNTSS